MRKILAASLLLWATPATAQNFTGTDMLRSCPYAIAPPPNSNVATFMEGARCLGYLDGMMDTNSIIQSMAKGQIALFCAPTEGISLEQAARIVVEYLKANPNNLHMPGRLQAMIALRTAFPCKS